MKKPVILALAACLLLGGCAGLPTSGNVQAVQPSSTPSAAIGLAAQPPAEGAGPQDIVDGFLVACQAGLYDDFAVAREYLYSTAASSWNPLGEVMIFPDSQNVATSEDPDGSITAKVGTIGTLSSSGVFTETTTDASATMSFSLARNTSGQWRIVSLPDGIFLSEHLFDAVYTESPLYFLSPDSSSLVEDLRYFPAKSFATNAVEALLQGPTSWLVTGSHSAAPSGTSLQSSVNVTDGTATVDLSSQVLSASTTDRANLVAQITRTLLASSSIRDVEVTVGGAPLESAAVPDIPIYPYGSYPLSVIADGVPGTVTDGEITPWKSLEGVKSLSLHDLAAAYDSDGSHLAALTGDSTGLVTMNAADGTYATAFTGTKLVDPSYSSSGWVFTGEQANKGSIEAINGVTGVKVSLAAPWLANVTVSHIAVSREGSRVVVATESSGYVEIQVAAIHRGSNGVPDALGSPIQIGQSLVEVDDLAWIGASTLAVMGRTSQGSQSSIYGVRISGPISQIMEPYKNGVDVTAGRDASSLTVLTQDEVAMGREGGSWRALVTGVTSIALPG